MPQVLGLEPEHSARASLQSQIVNRCHSVPSPGAGLCSEWVSHVFYPVLGHIPTATHATCSGIGVTAEIYLSLKLE